MTDMIHPEMNFLAPPTIEAQIHSVDSKFKDICNQLRVMNRKIEGTQKRLAAAHRHQKRSFRYSLRIQLCVMEGVRNMFHEHALMLADVLDELRSQAGFIVIGRGAHQRRLDPDMQYMDVD